jgi:hypothetical protein
LIPVLAAFCIAAADLIISVVKRVSMWIHMTENKLNMFIVCGIGLFGLITSALLISTNITSEYFETISFIAHYLSEDIKTKDNDTESKEVTLIGGRWVPGFSWIFTYIFDRDVDFKKFYTSTEIKTPKEILIADPDFNRFILANNDLVFNQIRTEYNDTKTVLEVKREMYPFDSQDYPYSIIKIVNRQTMSTPLEIRSNY